MLAFDQRWFANVAVEWSVFGTDSDTKTAAAKLVPDTDFVNSNDRILFVINRNSFQVTGRYRVRLRLFSRIFSQT